MYRLIYFLAVVGLPIIFGWWLFVPLALLGVYLVKLPYEIIFAAALLDSVYYFGDAFWEKHLLAIFAGSLLLVAIFLNDRIYWNKKI